MATLEMLPLELLERILCNNELTASDLVNCSQVSCFQALCESDHLWHLKLRRHYPSVLAKLKEDGKLESARELYIQLCGLYDRMCHNVLALSHVFVWSVYLDYEWPDIPTRSLRLYTNMFNDLVPHGLGKHYVRDECYNIVHYGDPRKDLTLRYYSMKIYCYLNRMENFDLKWHSASPVLELNTDAIQHRQFDCYNSAYKLSAYIHMTERIDKESMTAILNSLYNSVDECIRQYNPRIFKNHLRATRGIKDDSKNETSVYTSSECAFLMKQIHDTVIHEYNFKSVTTTTYRDYYKYCLDKVLVCRVGHHKLITTLQAHLAQHYGICFEVHEDSMGRWRIYYKVTSGNDGYYECPRCQTGNPANKCLTVITERLFYQSILESLINNYQVQLKSDWPLDSGPYVYNLLTDETYIQPMKKIFSAWRLVEHWKTAQLRHYYLLLERVTDDRGVAGKVVHLNMLLRVNSNRTLEVLADYRRQVTPPPPTGVREMQRMVASVNIRATARLQELKAMLGHQVDSQQFFMATFHPYEARPWPHSWPGSDMVQKRRGDRKGWQVMFAVGQIVEVCRQKRTASPAAAAAATSMDHSSSNVETQQSVEGEPAKTEEFCDGTASGDPAESSAHGHREDVETRRPEDSLGDTATEKQESEKNVAKPKADGGNQPPPKIDCTVNTTKPTARDLCVIYDWSSMCTESEELINNTGESELVAGLEQPFYKVLLDNGSSAYIAQENIRHSRSPRPINNPLIGRYFRAYVHPCYIPNIEKAYEYPEDATIREQDSFILSLL